MAGRRNTLHLTCTTDGCTKTSHIEFDTLTERRDYLSRNTSPYLCARHRKPSEVLSTANPVIEHTLTASVVMSRLGRENPEPLDGLFWLADGQQHGGSGVTFGPGFKAWASDFPEGTRLVITARIELPDGTEVTCPQCGRTVPLSGGVIDGHSRYSSSTVECPGVGQQLGGER